MAKTKTKPKADDPYSKLGKGKGKGNGKKPDPEPEAGEPTQPTDDKPPEFTAAERLAQTLLRTHHEVGKVVPKPDADQLHMKCLRILTRLKAGGMINPYATAANADVEMLIRELTKAVTE